MKNTYISPGPTDSRTEATQTLDLLRSYFIGGECWDSLSRTDKYELLETRVGSTPSSEVKVDDQTITVKEEFRNPSGSHYDRAYIYTLRRLETEGFIVREMSYEILLLVALEYLWR
jgi:threonine synthase